MITSQELYKTVAKTFQEFHKTVARTFQELHRNYTFSRLLRLNVALTLQELYNLTENGHLLKIICMHNLLGQPYTQSVSFRLNPKTKLPINFKSGSAIRIAY
jgi:hypothetical protein